MKLFYLSIIACFLNICFTSCSNDENWIEEDVCVNIEDDVLRDFCYSKFDLDHNGKINPIEAEAVRMIIIDEFNYSIHKTIKSLKGIDVFKNLNGIILENAVLTDIEVLSRLSDLQNLVFAKCAISDIDALYQIKNLRALNIRGCEIPAIDGTLIPDLTSFKFDGTLISDLDFSKKYALRIINFYPQNQITLYLPKEMEGHVLFSSNDFKVSIQYGKTEGCALEFVEGNSNVNVAYK